MAWPRKLGVFLVATGALLCAIYGVPTLYGSVAAHLAVVRFGAQSSTNSLWDRARIRAYQRTLAVVFPPPEAILRIPRLGVEVPVLEGVSALTLNRAAGHIPGTAMPGEVGNVAITGHRDGFFRPLKDAAVGDEIELDRASPTGPRTDRYRIRKLKVVAPSDTSVLRATSGPTLTLITCYPFYFVGAAPRRFVVQAELLPSPDAPAASSSSLSIASTHPGD